MLQNITVEIKWVSNKATDVYRNDWLSFSVHWTGQEQQIYEEPLEFPHKKAQSIALSYTILSTTTGFSRRFHIAL